MNKNYENLFQKQKRSFSQKLYFSENNLQKMKIALIQYNPVWENKFDSMSKINRMTENLSEIDLLIFPEMTLTGFSMNSKNLSEKIDGETFQFFSALSEKIGCNIIYGFIQNEDEKIFNSAVQLNKAGNVVSVYHKIHPFSYSDENKFYSAGTSPIISTIEDCKIGLSICYDLRFPELYRRYAKAEVDLIINIANWPEARIHHWDALLKARAIENLSFVAAVNRVGSDPKLNYTGHSSLYSPTGEKILFSEMNEEILIASIQIDDVNKTRKNFPFLDDIKLI